MLLEVTFIVAVLHNKGAILGNARQRPAWGGILGGDAKFKTPCHLPRIKSISKWRKFLVSLAEGGKDSPSLAKSNQQTDQLNQVPKIWTTVITPSALNNTTPPPPPPARACNLLSAGNCPARQCPVACEMAWQP